LTEIISDAIELAEPRAASANVVLKVDGPLELPVEVDPMMLGQAVLNLVLNAIDAQPNGGEVMVRYAAGAGDRGIRQLSLEVIDRGCGIPADAIDRIFNPFFTTKDEGTGLGLAIVHRIVEAHDGVISASNNDGGGARFEIRI
jgi:signal transduction histidine kinase